MKRKIGFVFAWCIFQTAFGQSVIDYVDPFICTAGDHGQSDPAACVPFGMIKPGPDTDPGNHSGYNYEAGRIAGFSQNRIGGTGCLGAGGNLRILPGIGDMNIQSSPVSKESEKASPCYYSVEFSNRILAELTATNQTAIHRYTFPEAGNAFVMIDAGSSFAGTISAVGDLLDNHEFNATVSARNVCGVGRYTVHYHVWCNKELLLDHEKDHRFYFRFKTKAGEQILFYVTTSPVSTGSARAEWESVTKNMTFEQVRQNGRKQWEDILSRVVVEGKQEYKTLFYTHLYHSLLNPVKSENHSKEFRATDGQIYKAEGYTHYDSWSMWDNFRNKFSLYSILIPDVSSDIAKSMIDLFRYGMPYWAGYQEPVPTVRTEHTVITLLDLYRRGVTDFDIAVLYNKLMAEINNISSDSPDKKLEKSYDLWALAQFAKILDKEEDHRLLMTECLLYKRVWKEKFLPITEKSDIMHGDGLYEGTLWQYRWHVPFDVEGMIEMIGGKEKYTEQLEYFFEHDLYNHGNQPDIHVPFMFNFGSKPWLTQKWVNRILTKDMYQWYGTHEKWEKPYYGRIYKAEPAGYIPEMDDDEGTMSAWYVLSSVGLYPVLVGEPVFQLSSPVFDRVIFKLENGKTFEIDAENLSDSNFYIRSATLNGKPFNQTWISQDDILKGGKLVFKLSDTPNTSFGL